MCILLLIMRFSSKLSLCAPIRRLRSLRSKIFCRSIVKIRILIAGFGNKLSRLMKIFTAFSIFSCVNNRNCKFCSISCSHIHFLSIFCSHFHSGGCRSEFRCFNRSIGNRVRIWGNGFPLWPSIISGIGGIIVGSSNKAGSFLSWAYVFTTSTHITKTLVRLMIQFCNDTDFWIV